MPEGTKERSSVTHRSFRRDSVYLSIANAKAIHWYLPRRWEIFLHAFPIDRKWERECRVRTPLHSSIDVDRSSGKENDEEFQFLLRFIVFRHWREKDFEWKSTTTTLWREICVLPCSSLVDQSCQLALLSAMIDWLLPLSTVLSPVELHIIVSSYFLSWSFPSSMKQTYVVLLVGLRVIRNVFVSVDQEETVLRTKQIGMRLGRVRREKAELVHRCLTQQRPRPTWH